MKDLGYISQEISKGKNLAVNLTKYSRGLSSMYHGLGFIKLSMNYYTVYDIIKEDGFTDSQYDGILNRFNQVISNQILPLAQLNTDDEEYEEKLKNLTDTACIDEIRNDIIKIMEVVTAFVDRLRIYEYVLNRIEYRYTQDVPDREYYGMYLTNDIMHYILADKDNVVINSKISEIVGQLPMRLSREKFFEYLREAFTLYHGAQKSTIDDFAYTLRTSAMIGSMAGLREKFPECYDIFKTLDNADYASADKAEYDRLRGALTIASEKITDCADMFVLLAQMVNDAYTILLTGKEAFLDVEEIQNGAAIIFEVNKCFLDENAQLSEELLGRFEAFEGKQERILSVVSKCDFAVDLAIANYKEKLLESGQLDIYTALAKTAKLQSGSDFVSLEINGLLEEVPENAYADGVCEELIAQLAESFKSKTQLVRRAVMSSVLSQLPVFFNSTEEIQNYINLSLEQCNDAAEQMAVIEVMKLLKD
ncbi:MAG: hypothetical protein Q4F11_01795 [Eubacteriales bacterium]|nr:hypothetical protein [Eubacteriales bacterium]